MAIFRSSKGGNLRIGLPPKEFGFRESQHPERAVDGTVLMGPDKTPIMRREPWPNIISKDGFVEVNDPALLKLLRGHPGNTANTGAAGMFFEEAEETTQAVALAQGKIVFKVPSGGIGPELGERLEKLAEFTEKNLPPNPVAMENIRMEFAGVLTEFQTVGVQAPPRQAEGPISTRSLLKSAIVAFFQGLYDGKIWQPEKVPDEDKGAA